MFGFPLILTISKIGNCLLLVFTCNMETVTYCLFSQQYVILFYTRYEYWLSLHYGLILLVGFIIVLAIVLVANASIGVIQESSVMWHLGDSRKRRGHASLDKSVYIFVATAIAIHDHFGTIMQNRNKFVEECERVRCFQCWDYTLQSAQ